MNDAKEMQSRPVKILKCLGDGLGLLWRVLAIFIFVANAAVVSAGNLSEGSYGYDKGELVKPICGGKGQDDCLGTPAIFEKSANPTCPSGTTFNLFTWACHSCPPGFEFSFDGGFDPDSERACSKETGPAATKVVGSQFIGDIVKATKTNTAPAEIHGTVCPAGSFYDPIRDGECWSCDSGYERSWDHVDMSTACVKAPRNDYKKIITHAKGRGFFGTDCPKGSGQFWDGWDGKCHSCPSGYKRSIQHVGTAQACFKYSGTITKAAQLVKEDAVCDEGQHVDPLLNPEKGGTCYSCPTTYVRTGEHVKSSKACGTPANFEFALATLEANLSCDSGQDFDFINWQHRRVESKALAAQRENNIKLEKSNDTGGTCWSCPDMSAGRSLAAVYEPDACVAPDIRWEMPDWTSPGVYGRYSEHAAEDLVTQLLTERSFINAIIDEVWNEDQEKSRSRKLFPYLSLPELRAAIWEEIVSRPETSGVLRLALKSILVRQAEGESLFPPYSKKYLSAFENSVTQYRMFLVEQSKAAFELWDARAVERDVYKSNQTGGETLKKIFFVSIGMPWPPQSVPDYRSEAEELTLDLQTTEAALKMSAITGNLSIEFKNELLPVSYVKPQGNNKRNDAALEAKAFLEGEIQGAIEEQIEKGVARIAARAAGGNAAKVASVVLKLAKLAEGPLLAIEVILTIQETYGEVIIDRLTMKKQYENALSLMSLPYSLSTALKSNDQTGEFDLYFNVITHNEPEDRGFKKISPPAAWTKVLCPEGDFVLENTGAVCNLGCPVAGSKIMSNDRCDYAKAPKYVASVFASESDVRHFCATGSYYKQDDKKREKSCATCPLGYEKYGNWDGSIFKITSTDGPFGECVFKQQQTTVLPAY
jgi:hypothetical protein